MKSLNIKRQHLLIALLLCVTCLSSSVVPQQSQRRSKDELITAAREIMMTARYCALITIGRGGRANARANDAVAPHAKLIILVGTEPFRRQDFEIFPQPPGPSFSFPHEEQAFLA